MYCAAKNKLLTLLRKTVIVYKKSSMNVAILLMDHEFECLRNKIPYLNLTMTATNKHVKVHSI